MPMPKWGSKANHYQYFNPHHNSRGSTYLLLALCITLSLLSLLYLHFRSLAAAGRDISSLVGDTRHPLDARFLRTTKQRYVACQAGCSWNAASQQCDCSSRRTATCARNTSRSSSPCAAAAAGATERTACEAQGCCWQEAAGGVQGCFEPRHVSWSTYEVLSSKTSGAAGTDLLLGLVQPVLPQYGEDYEQLEVQVRHETPARLHVKISAAGVHRYEVPETLLPRPGFEQFPASAARYKVHLPAEGEPFSLAVSRCSRPAASSSSSDERIECDGDVGSQRRQMRGAVFNSTGFGLVFKPQYLELSTRISSAAALYGLGQRVPKDTSTLRLPRNGAKIVLWNYDTPSSRTDVNLYGSHPFLMVVAPDGTTSGLLLLNSNGMEVTLDSTQLTYRVIGGLLDLYMFLGPSPDAVLQQYQQVVGRPAMPPYWSLGFHQSRWGYRTLGAVQDVVAKYKAAGIPLEVIWTDIDYMDRFRDFTFDPVRFPVNAMREFVASLHASGQRWVPIIDCGIPVAQDDAAYREGLAAGVFINDMSGKPYTGQVWPGATHYPDFTSPNRTWPWWQQQLQRMRSQVPFDGIWIDMNEPSNFCTGEVCRKRADTPQHKLLRGLRALSAGSSATKPLEASNGYLAQEVAQLYKVTTCQLDCTEAHNGSSSIAYPPYAIAHGVKGQKVHHPRALGHKTIAMSATGVDGELLYNTHNIYGLSQAAATHSALENVLKKRPFILTRSTFPGSGRFAAHWSGDNNATWAGLRQSVHSLLASSMWGMPLAGSDICGFLGNTTEELCARWMSAGAFYTFSRNHNSIFSSAQEPYLWPSVAAAARKALAMKYRLLPHLYSWFYRAHMHGGSVARPLFFAFPGDAASKTVADQWLLGDNVLVSPVLEEGMRNRRAYFPPGKWYDLWNQTLAVQGPKIKTLEAPVGDVPLHLRGGSILALQQPGSTTAAVRASPLTLMLALDQSSSSGSTEWMTQSSTTLQERCSTVVPPEVLVAVQGAGRSTAAAGSSSSSSSSSDMQLAGCGLLYLDSGESIEVPDVRGGYLLLHFTAAASKDLSKGWLRATPAAATAARRLAAGAQGGTSLHDVPKVREVLILGLPLADAAASQGGSRQHRQPGDTRRLHAATAAATADGGGSIAVLPGRPDSARLLLADAAADDTQQAAIEASELPPGTAYITVPESLTQQRLQKEQQRKHKKSSSASRKAAQLQGQGEKAAAAPLPDDAGSSAAVDAAAEASSASGTYTYMHTEYYDNLAGKEGGQQQQQHVSAAAGPAAAAAAAATAAAAAADTKPGSFGLTSVSDAHKGPSSSSVEAHESTEPYLYGFDTYYDANSASKGGHNPTPQQEAAAAAAFTKLTGSIVKPDTAAQTAAAAAAAATSAAAAKHVQPRPPVGAAPNAAAAAAAGDSKYQYQYHAYYDSSGSDAAAEPAKRPAAGRTAAAGKVAAGKQGEGSAAASGAHRPSSSGEAATAASRQGPPSGSGSSRGSSSGVAVTVDGRALPAGEVVYDATKQLLRVTGLQGADLSRGFELQWAAGVAAAV